ncbi:MAG: hypothetical protein IT299_06440 [Dehalococcoidia bacterium]|nr:hypothetical protein [Dehalococcoidia bacterium]
MLDTTRATEPLALLYERAVGGRLLAIEVVTARRWSPRLLDPPDPTRADVRVVLLASSQPPETTPTWLGVANIPARIAEDLVESGPYARPRADLEVALRVARGLTPAAGLLPEREFADFLAAGATAVRHPAPVPAEAARRLEVIRDFSREHGGSLGALPELAALPELDALTEESLEWHIVRRFDTPDAFSTAILLERLRESMPDVASTLRALNDARIAESSREWAELALDRRALLAAASPWRFIEGADTGPALAAVRSWLRRYEGARRAVHEHWRKRALDLRGRIEREMGSLRALERLNSIASLGPPRGEDASAVARGLRDELLAFDPAADTTTPLGPEPPLFARVQAAFEAVRGQLEARRQRLAAATVSVVLDQPGGPDVSRLLQAIQACDVDGIERALDARLAAHIEAVLERRTATPLQALTARYSEVDADTLDEVLAAFRELLADALLDAGGRPVPLA